MGEHPPGKVTPDPLERVLQRAITRMRRAFNSGRRRSMAPTKSVA
jgi:hypothetical protein